MPHLARSKERVSVEKLIRTWFLRYYASSLQRSWLKSPEAAFGDARFRITISLAAPFILPFGIVSVVLRQAFPLSFSHQSMAVFYGMGVVIGNLATYFALLRFGDLVRAPDIARNFSELESSSEIALRIFCGCCVVAYIVLIGFI